MKTVKLSLTVLACAMMAACGSSGGSSDNQGSNSQSNTANNSSKPVNNKPSPINSSNTGNAFVVKAVGEDDISISNVQLSKADLNKITVEGKEIQIGYPGISSKIWNGMSVGDTALFICCGAYSDTRFGAYEGGPDDNAYFFHNGNPTKDMPTSGVASYNGHVIIAGDTPHFDDEDYLKGSTQFTADFANKALEGSLNVDTMKAINVKANISGNNFAGTASSTDFRTSANVNGKFYGDNAKELSGVFNDGKTWGGAFGATKTK